MQELNEFDTFETSNTDKTVNFGGGVEYLMNDRKKSSSNINIDLGELDRLENELNELNDIPSSKSSSNKILGGFAENLFNFNPVPETNDVIPDSKLGNATANSVGNASNTFEGFSRMNDTSNDNVSKSSERDKRRKKRMMIKKLEEWGEKGLIKGHSFTVDSPYEEIEDEYECCLDDKRKKDSIKVQGWWFMTFVNSIEYANSYFDPFDLNLDGWGEQVNEDLESYDEIFTELHHKYKGGKMSPELSLLLRLGFSASVVNFTNKALSTATPGFNDVIKQSPELMKMFTQATVQSMSQQSPGFSFASNMMSQDDNTNTTYGSPPPPIETKLQPPSQRPLNNMQFSQRPDIKAGRSNTMFRESAVVMNNSYDEIKRPEMKGPQNMDVNKLFPGLKAQEESSRPKENDSIISISSMKELMDNSSSKPTKKSRRKSSEKNTISLDI
jgi:Family of unknown function (DUF5767)